jgi:lipoprotein-anchoring transpeptidase ErfK/SrfK
VNNKFWIIGGIVVLTGVSWLAWPKGKQSEADKTNPTGASIQQMVDQAKEYSNQQDLAKAKETYQEIISEHPDFNQIESVQQELENINMKMVLSNAASSDSVIHEVQSGDTLGKLAKKYGTTIELIKKKNNLKGDTIRLGQKLSIWTAPFNIFVDKSQNVLYLKRANDVMKVYTVSTGANNSTPIGDFTIASRLEDPVWFNKGIVVPPESPANALGSRWLGFDTPGYGIHGTIEPETIGRQVTAGCVRMLKDDVEELYSMIPMGTKVVIVD